MSEHFTDDFKRALAGADSVELQAVQALLLDRYSDAVEEALRPASDQLGIDGVSKAMYVEEQKAYARGVMDALQDIRDAMVPGSVPSD